MAALLVRDGHQVITFQRSPSGVQGATDELGSVTDAEAVTRAFSGADAVIHLAAKVSLSGSAAEFSEVNVEGTRKVLRIAGDLAIGRLVFVSSPSVVGSGTSIVGDGAAPANPLRARGDYARTKATAELLALAADSTLLRVVVVRPHLVWGPGDTQLVARIVERARRGRLPTVGSGAALIDSTYVETAASGIVAALDQIEAVHGNCYVVTNGEPRPVAEIMASLCVAAGVKPPDWRIPAVVARSAGALVEAVWRIRPGVDEPPMTRFLAEQLSTAHWFDQRRTRADLKWVPPVTLDDGFARLAAFYRATNDR